MVKKDNNVMTVYYKKNGENSLVKAMVKKDKNEVSNFLIKRDDVLPWEISSPHRHMLIAMHKDEVFVLNNIIDDIPDGIYKNDYLTQITGVGENDPVVEDIIREEAKMVTEYKEEQGIYPSFLELQKIEESVLSKEELSFDKFQRSDGEPMDIVTELREENYGRRALSNASPKWSVMFRRKSDIYNIAKRFYNEDVIVKAKDGLIDAEKRLLEEVELKWGETPELCTSHPAKLITSDLVAVGASSLFDEKLILEGGSSGIKG